MGLHKITFYSENIEDFRTKFDRWLVHVMFYNRVFKLEIMVLVVKKNNNNNKISKYIHIFRKVGAFSAFLISENIPMFNIVKTAQICLGAGKNDLPKIQKLLGIIRLL